jgi:hypothetical protein
VVEKTISTIGSFLALPAEICVRRTAWTVTIFPPGLEQFNAAVALSKKHAASNRIRGPGYVGQAQKSSENTSFYGTK